jgi:invasion protein IalB
MLRQVIISAVGAAFALGGSALAQVAPATSEPALVNTFGEWQERCETPKSCALVQSVADESHAEVAISVIAIKGPAGKPILRIIAPLGVLLPSGMGLKIDQADMGAVAFARCVPNGCIAEAELSSEQMAKLSGGVTATFTLMQTPTQGAGLPVSLNGFKDGFAALPQP